MKSELNGIIALESRYIYKKWLGLLKRTTETSGPVSKLICIYESTKSSLTLTNNKHN